MVGIDEDVITDFSYQVSNRFEAINTRYIQLMGEHIRDIGELTATDIHRTEQIVRLSANCEQIKRELALQSGKSVAEIDQLYDELLNTSYKDSQYLYAIRNNMPLAQAYNQLQAYTQAMKNVTMATFANIAKTTVIDTYYQNLVDNAVMLVTQGVSDYKSAMRSNLKQAATGARVQYKSGYTRRLDSAIRMNILDGARQLNQGLRDLEGQQFGADGVEVSAHALCAPDHLDIEGEQFTLRDFDRANNMLARQIGTCNCQHTYYPIILGISKPAYSKQELTELRNNSTQEITIDGKTKSKYEWSQVCRKLETEMRYTKDQHIIGTAAGDTKLVKECNTRLNKLRVNYRNVCDNTGLTKHYDRAYVPGFSGRQVQPKQVNFT